MSLLTIPPLSSYILTPLECWLCFRLAFQMFLLHIHLSFSPVPHLFHVTTDSLLDCGNDLISGLLVTLVFFNPLLGKADHAEVVLFFVSKPSSDHIIFCLLTFNCFSLFWGIKNKFLPWIMKTLYLTRFTFHGACNRYLL